MMMAGALRFWARGWIADVYLRPPFHFTYPGFSWVRPWPGDGLYLHFLAIVALSACVALGLCYRLAAALLFLAFTYVELLEKAAYLNHYYLISVLALLLALLPAHGAASLDARRDPSLRRASIPAYQLGALRLQVALVYVFAGVAKLNGDWLVRALPLKIWLRAHTDLPLVGPWLADVRVAHAMSLAGAAFDLTIPLWLLWSRTRVVALVCVFGFHAITGLLFPLGVFPWIMTASALLLLPASWPRRLLGRAPWRRPAAPRARPTKGQRLALAALALHFTIQLAAPLRHHLYPGDVAWTEEGGRFAWRVMLVEKVGAVTYRVRDPATGRRWRIDPEDRLTEQQAREMAVQPDMIREYARHLADEFAARGVPDVAVYADAFVTLHGEPAARLIDPDVDLARVDEPLGARPWVLPRPR
ncbi:MAG: HTTM domain-containing protein [Myxococcales bacterium]|nr:HTTM domain-containing protein [Myxococcales bacterium]